LIGAALFLTLSTLLGVYALTTQISPHTRSDQPSASQSELSNAFDSDPSQALTPDERLSLLGHVQVPEAYQDLYRRLSLFMQAQGFTESGLTLTRLADRLDSQEHRLRILINQSLGYRNFSHYLNDYRLPLACELLLNKPQLPITELAYDMGYGSITSFNRAFKEAHCVSPSIYRAQNKG
jgi:AraC-like DNA-binding protein